jgi:hypothetical protein
MKRVIIEFREPLMANAFAIWLEEKLVDLFLDSKEYKNALDLKASELLNTVVEFSDSNFGDTIIRFEN